MGLSSLDAALTGLRASQQQISVISNNVANVNTAGYTRKILPQNSQAVNGETVGVRTGIIARNVDLNLERDLWTQVSAVGNLEVRQSYLQRIEKFHGPPDAEMSVAAEMARLRDAFSSLADTPEDPFLLAQTVISAENMAQKINDLGKLIMQSRNDAQDEMDSTVTRVNQLLEQIADLNNSVQDNLNIGRSTAQAEDQRDLAIKELAGLMDISFFKRGDGVLVVQTSEGVELASEKPKELYFDPTRLGASSYYPDSAAAIYVVRDGYTGTDPATDNAAINITERNIGGSLGGLIQLRDQDFPKQLAQLDEMAHKMALRFEAQGVQLFTDASGNIPSDNPPDLSTNPPTAVEYVGFSLTIQVNQDILADNTLIQRGTYGDPNVQTGSSEVIRRIIEFTFGDTEYEIAQNTDVNSQVDLVNRAGGADLQTWLGLFTGNSVTSTQPLGQNNLPDPDGVGGNSSIDTLVASALGALDDPNDQFTITFDNGALTPAAAPTTISVDLSAIDAGATTLSAAEEIAAFINNQIALAAPDGRFNPRAEVTPSGQLVIRSNSDITIDASGANGMGQAGLDFLGLQEGTFTSSNHPYFDVQVGDDEPVRITIAPGETHTDLLNKLQAVPNLAAWYDAEGHLQMRPGDDDVLTNPQSFGGDLKITGGPFTTLNASYADTVTASTRASIDDGVNISSALFGTYTMPGGFVQNNSPVSSVRYQSETSVGSGVYTSFRNSGLGPAGNISTGVIGSNRLVDFSQKMVNQHSSELINLESAIADEDSLREILETQLLNDSGVNLDEELSNLVVYQTAFSASARVVSAVDEMFQELLNAF